MVPRPAWATGDDGAVASTRAGAAATSTRPPGWRVTSDAAAAPGPRRGGWSTTSSTRSSNPCWRDARRPTGSSCSTRPAATGGSWPPPPSASGGGSGSARTSGEVPRRHRARRRHRPTSRERRLGPDAAVVRRRRPPARARLDPVRRRRRQPSLPEPARRRHQPRRPIAPRRRSLRRCRRRVPGAGHRPGPARRRPGRARAPAVDPRHPRRRPDPAGPSLDAAALDSLWWAERAGLRRRRPHRRRHVRPTARRKGRSAVGPAPAFEPLAAADGTDLASRPTWSHLAGRRRRHPGRSPPSTQETVGDHATATAGFRDQFYGLQAHVTDGPTEAPLVTAGLLEPGRCAWGERPARFAGRRLDRPGVDLRSLARDDPKLARWVADRRVPKVLLATQTAVLEAAVDPTGAWVPSVPVISVEPRAGTDVWTLAAVLGSPVGLGLGGGDLPRGRPRRHLDQARRQPGAHVAVARAAARTRPPNACGVGDVDGAARASLDAYGLEGRDRERVWAWWLGRRPGPAAGRVSATRRRAAPATRR